MTNNLSSSEFGSSGDRHGQLIDDVVAEEWPNFVVQCAILGDNDCLTDYRHIVGSRYHDRAFCDSPEPGTRYGECSSLKLVNQESSGLLAFLL